MVQVRLATDAELQAKGTLLTTRARRADRLINRRAVQRAMAWEAGEAAQQAAQRVADGDAGDAGDVGDAEHQGPAEQASLTAEPANAAERAAEAAEAHVVALQQQLADAQRFCDQLLANAREQIQQEQEAQAAAHAAAILLLQQQLQAVLEEGVAEALQQQG